MFLVCFGVGWGGLGVLVILDLVLWCLVVWICCFICFDLWVCDSVWGWYNTDFVWFWWVLGFWVCCFAFGVCMGLGALVVLVGWCLCVVGIALCCDFAL